MNEPPQLSERWPATAFVGLYPRAWRDRYGQELEAVLETHGVGVRGGIDLLRGALDAHLHPPQRSPLPVAAAITASALSVVHALAIAAQPTPPDWPGYIEEALPLIIGALMALIPTVIGLWLKLGDGDGALGRAGIVLALAGYLLWLVALVAAKLRIDYGAVTALASTIAMVGTAALGIALVGHGRLALGALVAAAALAGLAPPTFGWPLFAIAWTAVAVVFVLDFARAGLDQPGPLHA